jgi:hypothetical protein
MMVVCSTRVSGPSALPSLSVLSSRTVSNCFGTCLASRCLTVSLSARKQADAVVTKQGGRNDSYETIG